MDAALADCGWPSGAGSQIGFALGSRRQWRDQQLKQTANGLFVGGGGEQLIGLDLRTMDEDEEGLESGAGELAGELAGEAYEADLAGGGEGRDKENVAPALGARRRQLDRGPALARTQTAAELTSRPRSVLLMDKRQLVRALNATFLGELKSQLVERLHEFTDCAYTKHEHRESIVSLLACIKLQLNRLVKLIYRLVSVAPRDDALRP